MKHNPFEQWDVDQLLEEMIMLHKSGWDGIGYTFSAENNPDDRFFLAGGRAFDARGAIRVSLLGHKAQGRVPFFRYYVKCNADPKRITKVDQELCRLTRDGCTVIAALVLKLNIPNYFEQVTAGKSGEYFRERARIGCEQALSKLT
jgi:hypothetical protein